MPRLGQTSPCIPRTVHGPRAETQLSNAGATRADSRLTPCHDLPSLPFLARSLARLGASFSQRGAGELRVLGWSLTYGGEREGAESATAPPRRVERAPRPLGRGGSAARGMCPPPVAEMAAALGATREPDGGPVTTTHEGPAGRQKVRRTASGAWRGERGMTGPPKDRRPAGPMSGEAVPTAEHHEEPLGPCAANELGSARPRLWTISPFRARRSALSLGASRPPSVCAQAKPPDGPALGPLPGGTAAGYGPRSVAWRRGGPPSRAQARTSGTPVWLCGGGPRRCCCC